MVRSGTFPIYKSIGAAQFSLIPPQRGDKGFITKDGAILLECAPGDGDKNDPKWDWAKDKKISFALGLADLAQLLDATKTNIRLVHDNNGVMKTLEFRQGEGKYEGTYTLNLSEGGKENRRSVMVPLTNGEYNLLMRLLVAVAPMLIAWTPTVMTNVQSSD